MTEPNIEAEPQIDPIEQARQLLASGVSVRETARQTQLSKGKVEAIRHRLGGELDAKGLPPLAGARPGPVTVDLGVSVHRDLAARLDALAAAAGLDRQGYVAALLEHAAQLEGG